MVEVTDGSFEKEVLKAKQVVLVDVWAPWCGPCRALTPIIETLAATYTGRAVVATLNVDENPGVVTKYKISAIPTLLFFKEGILVEQMAGLQSEEIIKTKLVSLL